MAAAQRAEAEAMAKLKAEAAQRQKDAAAARLKEETQVKGAVACGKEVASGKEAQVKGIEASGKEALGSPARACLSTSLLTIQLRQCGVLPVSLPRAPRGMLPAACSPP